MPPPLYITAEDHKLHYLKGGALLICGKVMVRPAREDELASHVLCEHCLNATRTPGS